LQSMKSGLHAKNLPPPLLLALLGWSSGGCSGAVSVEAGGRRIPAYVDPTVDALESGNVAETVQGLAKKVSSAASRAQASAARAGSGLLRVQHVSLQSNHKRLEIRDAVGEVTSAGEMAALDAKIATASLKDSKLLSSEAVSNAKALAEKAVQDLFTKKYTELDNWRHAALTDGNVEAAREANVLAAPYKEAVNRIRKRTNEYTSEAAGMRLQANRLMGRAAKVHQRGEKEADSGDSLNAEADFEKARALRERASKMEVDAKEMDKTAKEVLDQAPVYMEAAGQAAKYAQNQQNPYGLPPLPVDPMFAYTPPPLAL